MKQVVVFLFLMVSPVLLFAQQVDSINIRKDSTIIPADSLLKPLDSLIQEKDSIVATTIKIDTIGKQRSDFTGKFLKILNDNKYLNWKGKPVAMINQMRETFPRDRLFYLLLSLTAILGFLRFFYTRYFNNLFRVFFNASLRQSQLTDQLLQAKLPSLFFNIVFIFAGGVYVYLLLVYYNWVTSQNFWLAIIYCSISLGAIYFIKFLSLKFTGWLTGYQEVTNTYVFIIFLINKILGVVLIPFAVIIAFAAPAFSTVAVIISLLLISLMFLLRFFRSFGLLQHKLKISRFHFFLYVIGIEIIPLLLIYKGLVLLLSKNL